MRLPTTPTTPEQLSVIVWTSILVFAAIGTVGMWFCFRAPAAKAEQATQLFWYSLAFWTLAAIIYGVNRTVGRFFR